MNFNGRVNILEEHSQDVFSLYDKIPINQKITSYNDAMTGNFENSNLTRAFFSAKNIIRKSPNKFVLVFFNIFF